MKKFLSNRNSLGRKTIGFVMLALGILLVILLAINAFTDFPLWIVGKTVDGVVEEKWYELIDENEAGELTFTYHLRYSFTTADGEKIEGISDLSAYEWSALIEEGRVRVVYSSFDPSNNRVDDSRFRPLLICAYVPFIFITWIFLSQGWEILSGEFVLNKSDLWRLEKRED